MSKEHSPALQKLWRHLKRQLRSQSLRRPTGGYTDRMKIFISWSGEPSETVARALKNWLPDVIQDVEPWMSAVDIEAGGLWSRDIQRMLAETRFGIICVTADNQSKPWIMFEAGALAKTIHETFVCPYLIDLQPSDLVSGPLTQFQAKRANRSETHEVIRTMNTAMKEAALPADKLDRAYERWWPDLERVLDGLPQAASPAPHRPVPVMVAETLDAVRELQRQVHQLLPERPSAGTLDRGMSLDRSMAALEDLRPEVLESYLRRYRTMNGVAVRNDGTTPVAEELKPKASK